MLADGDAVVGELFDDGVVAVDFQGRRHLAQAVGDEAEFSGGGDFGVELLEGSGGEIAGVGELLLAGGGALLVDFLELGVGHENFAANFKDAGKMGAFEAERDGSDGASVGGDVVAAPTVAARGGQDQNRIFVAQADGDAVDFGLEHVLDRGGFAEELVDAGVEGFDFGFIVSVVDAHHGDGMLDGDEAVDGLAADPLGRGIGRLELGVGGFEVDELPHEAVEFLVADLGLGLDEIEIVVPLDLFAEFFDLLLGRGCHGD